MNTGLFRLFKAVGRKEDIADYLDNSSYDELIEFDINNDRFTKHFHTAKKYVSLLTEGSYKDLYVSLSELSVHPEDKERFCALMDPFTLSFTLHSSEIPGLICEEFRFRMLNESWCWVELVLASGEIWGLPKDVYRIYIFDIHSRKMRESGLNEAFLYSDNNRNETTGLLMKSAFVAEVGKMTKDIAVNWCLVAVDIDNFKLYNEWYGHSSGDLLMAQIGTKIKDMTDLLGGTAGYFGQDDFCLLIPFNKEAIDDLYAEIAMLVAVNGNDTGFKPAFGISLVDAESEIADMIDRAFLAVRVAKQSFHKRIRLYDPGMYSQEDAEYHILADFMQAIKRQEITFYLQPQCRASTGKIVGAEALCRWILPNGSIVPPDQFIPVLEKHGLITDLDLYIWEKVCKWQWQWIGGGNTPLPVSVNVSATDIMNINLTETFSDLTEKYQLPHDLIKIEITESAYSLNAALVKNTVHELRDSGFTVMMDDFGSGYSTLNMLSNLAVDVIKLDAQFLAIDENNSEKGIQILESVTTMSKTIGLPIIVEGVENEEQEKFLMDMGCSYFQGFFFYRPMDTKSYEELIADLNHIDTSGITFKANQQFQLREILDNNVYSDTMLNNILGPCALYSWQGEEVDIIRFNQQFYRAVDVPDFMDRLDNIRRFIPPLDIDRMYTLLEQAKEDRLNGSEGRLHFYKTDGSLTTFNMHFYYLRREEDRDIFYGSVQNITRLSMLEKQIQLLSRFSAETIIFLTRKPDGTMNFSVLFNALEKELGMTREQFEDELNSKEYLPRLKTCDSQNIYDSVLEHIEKSESFKFTLNTKDVEGKELELLAYGDYVIDDTNTMDYIITIRKAMIET